MVTRAEEAQQLDDIPATIPETDDWYQDEQDEADWFQEQAEERDRQWSL